MTLTEYYAYTGQLAQQVVSQRVASGEHPNRPPLGYTPEGTVDRVMKPLIRRMFYAALTYNTSIRRLQKEADRIGLRSRTGKPLGPSALWGMLTNPYYCGKVRYRGAVLPGTQEPIVSEKVFELVQHVLSRRNKSVRKASVQPVVDTGLEPS